MDLNIKKTEISAGEQISKLNGNQFYEKRECEGEICVVLHARIDQREMNLMAVPSRAVLKNEIHELISIDEETPSSGIFRTNVAYWGFFEVTVGSVLAISDEVNVGGKIVGRIAGFDQTHMPNHLNILVKVANKATGKELNLRVGDKVSIVRR